MCDEDEVDPDENQNPDQRFKKLKHPIHFYFSFDKKSDKSKCLVANSSIVGNPKCGAFLKGKNPTNLVNHVRTKHVGAFKEYLIKKAEKDKEDEAKKKKTSPSTVSDVSKSNSMVQPTLSEVSA